MCPMYCEDGGLGCVVCGTYVKYTYWAANPGRAMLMLPLAPGMFWTRMV